MPSVRVSHHPMSPHLEALAHCYSHHCRLHGHPHKSKRCIKTRPPDAFPKPCPLEMYRSYWVRKLLYPPKAHYFLANSLFMGYFLSKFFLVHEHPFRVSSVRVSHPLNDYAQHSQSFPLHLYSKDGICVLNSSLECSVHQKALPNNEGESEPHGTYTQGIQCNGSYIQSSPLPERNLGTLSLLISTSLS